MLCLRLGRLGLINGTAWSSRDTCVNWNEPQASRLQFHEQPSVLNVAWVRAGGCKRRYPKGQSRTCYQECGCHLNYPNIIVITTKSPNNYNIGCWSECSGTLYFIGSEDQEAGPELAYTVCVHNIHSTQMYIYSTCVSNCSTGLHYGTD